MKKDNIEKSSSNANNLQESPDYIVDLMLRNTSCYINAGGEGSRLTGLVEPDDKGRICKANIKLGTKKIIDFHVDYFAYRGFKNIIVSAGDHTDVKVAGENKTTLYNTQQHGNGGDLLENININPDQFAKNILISNVDTFIVYDEKKLLKRHWENIAKGAKATIMLTTLVHNPKENVHMKNSGKFLIDENDKVIFNGEAREEYLLPKPDDYAYQASSTGVLIIDRDYLQNELKFERENISIYKDILGKLSEDGLLFCYNNKDNYMVDVGTQETFYLIKKKKDEQRN